MKTFTMKKKTTQYVRELYRLKTSLDDVVINSALFEHILSYTISVLKSGCVGGAPTPPIHAFTMTLLPTAASYK
jgi:hypothetical protein